MTYIEMHSQDVQDMTIVGNNTSLDLQAEVYSILILL